MNTEYLILDDYYEDKHAFVMRARVEAYNMDIFEHPSSHDLLNLPVVECKDSFIFVIFINANTKNPR